MSVQEQELYHCVNSQSLPGAYSRYYPSLSVNIADCMVVDTSSCHSQKCRLLDWKTDMVHILLRERELKALGDGEKLVP